MDSRPSFTNSAFYGRGRDSFSSPLSANSLFSQTPRRVDFQTESEIERGEQMSVISQQQRKTDERVQSLLERFSIIESTLKDFTNTISQDQVNVPTTIDTASSGYKRLPRGLSVSCTHYTIMKRTYMHTRSHMKRACV